MFASANNPNPKVLLTLVQAGANVNEKDRRGETPLILAMENEASLEIISALVEAGADVNEKNSWGETPLILAAKKDNAPKVIAFLIEAGADTNARDQYGKRAFDHAQYSLSRQNDPNDDLSLLLEALRGGPLDWGTPRR